MYESVLPSAASARVFVEQIFRIFDADSNGFISFKVLSQKDIHSMFKVFSFLKEFMLATDMTTSGSADEKARWTFKMFDSDASGTIEMSEIIYILEGLYDAAGFSKESVDARAKELFKTLDLNKDGTLSENEFVKACVEDKEILGVLNACGIK